MIAEWVLMTSLVGSHHYNTLRDWQKSHCWAESQERKTLFQSATDRVSKRLGILGFGSIGRHVARIAKAMGMEILVLTASPPRDSRKQERRRVYCSGHRRS